MKILFIMDPLDRLYPKFDSSLYLLKEFYARGHETYFADLPDLYWENGKVRGRVQVMEPLGYKRGDSHTQKGHRYKIHESGILDLEEFPLVLYRKEPPFNSEYLNTAALLERLRPDRVFVSNNPAAIRKTCGEKIGCLPWSRWMPDTLVASDLDILMQFRKRLKTDLILKPLDQKSGIGVQKISRLLKNPSGIIRRATQNGRHMIMAQECLSTPGKAHDKRITILNGKIFWAFEKHAAPGNFRTNLDQGGKVLPTVITSTDKKLLKELVPYFQREGLHLVGLDIMAGKLIDLNVTCPGGFSYAIPLNPHVSLIGLWADFLEFRVSHLPSRRAS